MPPLRLGLGLTLTLTLTQTLTRTLTLTLTLTRTLTLTSDDEPLLDVSNFDGQGYHGASSPPARRCASRSRRLGLG